MLRVGVPFNVAGWSFHDKATNTDRGIVFDLLKAMNVRQVQYFTIAFGSLIPALMESRIDLIAGNLTITPERQQLVDFSTPFFTGADGLVGCRRVGAEKVSGLFAVRISTPGDQFQIRNGRT